MQQPDHPGVEHDEHLADVGVERRATGVGPANRKMWTAGIGWSLAWGLAGALVLFAVAWIPMLGLPLPLRLIGFTIAGFLGGSAAGFVYGAGRRRDVDAEARHDTRFAPTEDTNRTERRSQR
jgi:hypothetical protein